jgi:hypothetical protein
MQELPLLSAKKTLHEIQTDGHSPLVVSADNKRWLVKSSLRQPTAYYLASEVICAYFLELWGFKMPQIGLMRIENEVLDDFSFFYKTRNSLVRTEFLARL